MANKYRVGQISIAAEVDGESTTYKASGPGGCATGGKVSEALFGLAAMLKATELANDPMKAIRDSVDLRSEMAKGVPVKITPPTSPDSVEHEFAGDVIVTDELYAEFKKSCHASFESVMQDKSFLMPAMPEMIGCLTGVARSMIERSSGGPGALVDPWFPIILEVLERMNLRDPDIVSNFGVSDVDRIAELFVLPGALAPEGLQ